MRLARPLLIAAAGVGVLALTTGPGVDLVVQAINRAFDPGRVIDLMASAPMEALIDPGSLVRRGGPALGSLILVAGLAMLVLRLSATREPDPLEAPVAPEAISLPEAAPEPLADTVTNARAVDLVLPRAEPDWFQGSPSEAASAARSAGQSPAAPAPTRVTAPVALPSRYRVETRLGAGAMGVVYRAWDTLLDRPVAIKVVNEEMAEGGAISERFLDEARMMAKVSHPNVVTLHDVGVEGDRPYLVMEFLEGRHLRDVLDDLPGLPEKDVLRWGAQVAEGLACVHGHRLVHRDVKPENILLLAGSSRVKLMDFGIAHVLRSGKQATKASGTPFYMAPEQILGGPLGPYTDIYGLGATLFALMTGSLPFPEGEPLYHAVHTPAPDPRVFKPGLSAGTAALLLSCLAKEPAERPQSASDLAAGLRSLGGADSLPGMT